jgi:transcriptional regulator with XRE-family HTH domain
MNNFYRELGARVRHVRRDVGFKQREVAKVLHIPRSAVSELESGRRGMSAVELFRFCDMTGVTPNWLMGLAPETKTRIVVHR